jgi:CheY-like chemotaxis protein
MEQRGNSRPRTLVLGITDIFFLGRIEAALAAMPAGTPVPVHARADQPLHRLCEASQPCVLILDLQDPSLDPLGEVARIKAGPLSDKVEIIGFLPHVRLDLRDAARKAGVDRILVRSAFTKLLPQILAEVTSAAGS